MLRQYSAVRGLDAHSWPPLMRGTLPSFRTQSYSVIDLLVGRFKYLSMTFSSTGALLPGLMRLEFESEILLNCRLVRRSIPLFLPSPESRYRVCDETRD